MTARNAVKLGFKIYGCSIPVVSAGCFGFFYYNGMHEQIRKRVLKLSGEELSRRESLVALGAGSVVAGVMYPVVSLLSAYGYLISPRPSLGQKLR